MSLLRMTEKEIDEWIASTCPDREPFRTEWARLYTLHIAALMAGDLLMAAKLADKRYEVWLRSNECSRQ